MIKIKNIENHEIEKEEKKDDRLIIDIDELRKNPVYFKSNGKIYDTPFQLYQINNEQYHASLYTDRSVTLEFREIEQSYFIDRRDW